eukprot:SAG22_NODE_10367_length_539_cov_0.940909_2_plen_74_part_01
MRTELDPHAVELDLTVRPADHLQLGRRPPDSQVPSAVPERCLARPLLAGLLAAADLQHSGCIRVQRQRSEWQEG